MIFYDFSPLLMLRLPSQQPHVMAPLGSPWKTGQHVPNLFEMCVLSTPKIICVWSIICMNFYRLFPFMIFYDFLSNIKTSLKKVSLEYKYAQTSIDFLHLRFFMIFDPTSKIVSKT